MLVVRPVIYSNGSYEWRYEGEFHRIGGPAYVDIGGTEWWFINGKQHREDGPAVLYKDSRFGSGNTYWNVGKYSLCL